MEKEKLFEEIKRGIRSRKAKSLINAELDLLYKLDVSKEMQSNFWTIITLIRWTIEFGVFHLYSPKATVNDVIALVNKLNQLEDTYHRENLPKKNVNWDYVFHQIANQQLEYQNIITKYTFIRQLILFNYDDNIKDKFQKINGFAVSEWINELLLLCMYLVGQANPKNTHVQYIGRLQNDFFELFAEKRKLNRSQIFIESISINVDDSFSAKERLKNISAIKNPLYQIFDQFKFSLYPIIKIDGAYRVIHRQLLDICFKYNIYDNMKSAYGNDFTQEFGRQIERYVRLGLDELSEKYSTDNEKKKFNNSPDFVVTDNVIIECKGIETPVVVSVNPTTQNLERYLKDSIYKAFEKQILEAAKNIDSNRLFGVVITYKETNMGFGRRCARKLFKDDSSNPLIKYIKSDDIFVLAIEEWDIILNACKNHKLTLHEILSLISDLEKSSSKMHPSMHVFDYFGTGDMTLEYLNSESPLLFEWIKD